MEDIIHIIVGYSAAFLVSILNLPQAYLTVKNKKTEGVSIISISLHVTSSLLWIAYGFSLKEIPIIIANSLYFMANIVILYYCVTEKNRSKRVIYSKKSR